MIQEISTTLTTSRTGSKSSTLPRRTIAPSMGEAAKLVLDDVDCRQATIMIAGNQNAMTRFRFPSMSACPGNVPCPVLEGPRAYRRVVVSGCPAIVCDAGKRAGVRAAAHQLRHRAATSMLRAGASLSEVGQVLRHAARLGTPPTRLRSQRRGAPRCRRPWRRDVRDSRDDRRVCATWPPAGPPRRRR